MGGTQMLGTCPHGHACRRSSRRTCSRSILLDKAFRSASGSPICKCGVRREWGKRKACEVA